MSTNKDNDAFAKETLRRFDDFVSWTISNWPHGHAPLSGGDFSAGRRELATLLGPRLDAGNEFNDEHNAHPDDMDANPQYIPVTPAPWP